MQISTQVITKWFGPVLATMALAVFTGCQSASEGSAQSESSSATVSSSASTSTATTVTTVTAPVLVPGSTNVAVKPPVRIKAGLFTPLKDKEGNTWLPDQGFADGDTIERPGLEIANTKTPEVYHSERYSMTAFAYPVPNGKYTVKLHFCETFEGITEAGGRVFSYNVEGQEFKDLDIFVKTGGALRAYVHTVNVDIKDGKLDIKFTANVENPEINGIEILPAS
jgi:hypothetical protein